MGNRSLLSLSLGMLMLVGCQQSANLVTGGSLPAGQTRRAGPTLARSSRDLSAQAKLSSLAQGQRLTFKLADIETGFHTQGLKCDQIFILDVTITGIGMAPVNTSASPTPGSCTFTTGTIPPIPAGKSRVVTITAQSEGGSSLATIKAPVDIVDGQSTDFDISYRSHVTARIIEELMNAFSLASVRGFALAQEVPAPLPNQLGKVYAANMDLARLQNWVDSLIGVSGTFPDYSYTHHPLTIQPGVLADAIIANGGEIPQTAPSGYFFTPAALELTLTGVDPGAQLEVSLNDLGSKKLIKSNPSTSEVITIPNVLPGDWDVVVNGSTIGSFSFSAGNTTITSSDLGYLPVIPVAQWERKSEPAGGNIKGVARDADGDLYGISEQGLVYKSLNGTSWSQAGTGLPAGLKLQKIATNPADSSGKMVYISTDDGEIYYCDFKGGSTWTKMANKPFGGPITVLFAKPLDSKTLYAGNAFSQLKEYSDTSNTGLSWSDVNTGLSSAGVLRQMVEGSGRYFIATSTGVYYSSNTFFSWTQAITSLSDTNVNAINYYGGSSPPRLQIGTVSGQIFNASPFGDPTWSAAASGTNGKSITAIVQANDPPSHYIYATTSGGAALSAVDADNDGVPDSGFLPVGAAASPYPPYSPKNPFLNGAVLSNSNYLIAASQGAGFQSWDKTSWGTPGGVHEATVLSMLRLDKGGHQALYAGTQGGGVLRTTDNGLSWTELLNVGVDGLARNVNGLEVHFDVGTTYDLYMGTDAGVFELDNVTDSATDTTPWNQVGSGLNNVKGLLVLKDDHLLAATPTGIYRICAVGTSCSDTLSWTKVTSDASTMLVRQPGSDTTVYATRIQGLGKSSDGGQSWSSIAFGRVGQMARAIAVTPSNAQLLYVGFDGGFDGSFQQFARSFDGGISWTGSTIPGVNTIYSLSVSPSSANEVYAGTDKGVYVSVDSGSSWTAFTDGKTGADSLVNQPIATLMRYSDDFYAGSIGKGLYYHHFMGGV